MPAFFIALFRLMLCMGLPELSVQDIEFLRTSLMYEQMERKDVQVAFQHIFEDVIKSGWFTSINWFFHSVKHLSA